ncbi:MAG: hypothetical protein AAF483_29540, partial [Planctomycetota bacterium]
MLSWSEGYATYYSFAAQQAMGTAGLNIPLVGNLDYDDSEDGSTGIFNIETETGRGEDNELSILSILWDLADTKNEMGDNFALGHRKLHSTLVGAKADTPGKAWEALAAKEDNRGKAKLGELFALGNVSTTISAPTDGFVPDLANPPEFTWTYGGKGTTTTPEKFRVKFFTEDFATVVFTSPEVNTMKWKPTAAEWTMILAGDSKLHWVVESQDTDAPASPGGATGYYWSGHRSFKNTKFAFVIDDTGSMTEEIGGVRNALQTFVSTIGAGGGEPPLTQLITFKDSVTTRLTTEDLSAMSTAVAGLRASGGGGCPESSTHALERAAENVSPGGTILIATDAAPNPGVNLGSVLAKLRAKSIRVNTILSGDCEPIDGEGETEIQPGDFLPFADNLTNVETTSFLPEATRGKPGGAGNVPGDSSVVDPGQTPSDAHGNSTESATRVQAGGAPVMGSLHDDNAIDFFVLPLTADEPVTIELTDLVLTDDDSTIVMKLLGPDGSTELAASPGSPLSFTPDMTENYFVSIEGEDSFYELTVANDPFVGITSAVEVFSTISAQTGGIFLVRDEVNEGELESYEAAVLNTLVSTLQPVVIAGNPQDAPLGEEISIVLSGRATNWMDGATSVNLGEGVQVLSTSVQGPTRLTATIRVEPDATLGARDAVVSTPLGGGVEVAEGIAVLNIVNAISTPTVLSVEPQEMVRGQESRLLIRGVNTAWTNDTEVSFGSDVEVLSTNRVSDTLLEVETRIADSADIGFRSLAVTTDGETDELRRASFVSGEAIAIPTITALEPNSVDAGTRAVIKVRGINTNFDSMAQAFLGAGIEVLSVNAISGQEADVTVQIATDVSPGFRDVQIVTGGETATILSGLFVGGEGESSGQQESAHANAYGYVLELRGSNVNDQFVVSRSDTGEVSVTPQAGTILNGSTNTQTYNGIKRVVAFLGNGDDQLSITGGSLPYGAFLYGQSGNDIFTLNNASFDGPLHVFGENGNDNIQLQGVVANSEVILNTGLGEDLINAEDLQAQRSLLMFGESGNDTLSLSNSSVAYLLQIVAGHGQDNDIVALNSVSVGHDLRIEGGSYSKQVDVNQVTTGGSFFAFGGYANDVFTFQNMQIGRDLHIFTRYGDDQLM